MSENNIVYEDLVFGSENYRTPEKLRWWQWGRRWKSWRNLRRAERELARKLDQVWTQPRKLDQEGGAQP